MRHEKTGPLLRGAPNGFKEMSPLLFHNQKSRRNDESTMKIALLALLVAPIFAAESSTSEEEDSGSSCRTIFPDGGTCWGTQEAIMREEMVSLINSYQRESDHSCVFPTPCRQFPVLGSQYSSQHALISLTFMISSFDTHTDLLGQPSFSSRGMPYLRGL